MITSFSPDTGISATDGITSATAFTLSGTSAANTTVTIYANGVKIGTITSTSSGTWTFDVSGLADGTYVFAAATGKGKGTKTSDGYTITVDNTDPAAPTGLMMSGTMLSGIAEGSTTIHVYDDGVLLGSTTANASGPWAYNIGNAVGTISVTATDAAGNTSSNSTVTVGGTNIAPDAVDDSVTTNEDAAITVAVLGNDTDANGDQLGIASANAASNGSVTVRTDGTIVYTPNANWSGTDSFTYTVFDGKGGSDTATVTVTVIPVNDSPSAQNDSATTDEDTARIIGVLANDSDVDGDTLTVTIESQPANGTASVNPDRTITYTPNANFNGADSFTYRISDGNGGSAVATVNLTVAAANDAPAAADDSASTTQDAGITIAVLGNDSDPDGDTLAVIGATDGTHGTVVVNADNTIAYTPVAGYSGPDSFTYTISDGKGGTDTATVTVSVAAAPPPPPPPTGTSFTPTDTLYGEQWHLAMLGDIERIWAEFTGQGVVVGLYDDGIEYDHVDLDGNYVAAAAFGLPDPYPTTADEAKHGTAVAGVIAAEANGIGTVGVAFDATVSGVNIFSGSANINATNKTGFYAASDQQYRFDIVNHSWGSAPVYLNDVDALTQAVLADWDLALQTGRGGLGTIIVKAAGNNADNAQGDFLNAVRASITVAAYDSDGDASWYTNRGANVLISAPSSGHTIADGTTGDLLPGSDLRIATTDRDGSFGYADDGAWSSSTNVSGFGGTSSATPTVSGVVALMIEANDGLGWRDVQNILAYSAHHVGGDIGSVYTATETVPESWLVPGGSTTTNVTVPVEYFNWLWNGADDWNGGGLHFSEDYGFGGVDAYNAVRMAEVWSLFAPAQTSANEEAAATATMSPNLSVSGNGSTNSYQFNYSGPAMSLEYVDITIRLNTMLMQEVALEITSPDGTTVTLLDVPVNDYTPAYDFFGFMLLRVDVDWTFGANAFRGEDPNGVWTVTLTEKDVTFDVDNYGSEANGNTLSLLELDFYGRADGLFGTELDDDVYHYTSEMLSLGLAGDVARVSLADTAGNDWFDFSASSGDIVSNLAAGGTTTLEGVVIVQATAGTVIENAVGGDGNDMLTGNDAANELYGMRGSDTLLGGAANDTLAGRQDSDMLWGGTGDDLFLFYLGDGQDWIGDFSAGAGAGDVIALHGFSYDAFGDLVLTDLGGSTLIDLGSGDGITLAGLAPGALDADDFLFYAVA